MRTANDGADHIARDSPLGPGLDAGHDDFRIPDIARVFLFLDHRNHALLAGKRQQRHFPAFPGNDLRVTHRCSPQS